MPKIVDHDAVRRDIARRSVDLFRRIGYSGLSFRTIAKELGISKSGLYHYFEDKEALFLACGETILEDAAAFLLGDADLPPVDRILQAADVLGRDFSGELRLLLDLADVKRSEGADAAGVETFVDHLEAYLSGICGERHAPLVARLVYGDLLLRTIDRRLVGRDSLRPMIERILSASD